MSTSSFTPEEEAYYDRLADSAERGELPPPERVLTGEEALSESQRLFREMFGTVDPDELLAMNKPGRPRLDVTEKKKGSSPTINLRLSDEMKQAVEDLAERRQQSKSSILRELIATGLKHAS